ncbi:transglycosylase SLT domain-containing protein, partial [Escherichia coli]|uniref:transglycosylase SLT domain-containing protein n=1 Tax=Escherichia coli TaxID=562 RepID=UPI001FCF06E4
AKNRHSYPVSISVILFNSRFRSYGAQGVLKKHSFCGAFLVFWGFKFLSMNIYTGAYYLAIAFKKWGITWEAVGAYNAGFRKTERQNQRRLAYASDVYRIYTGIKSSKGIRIPVTKKSLPEINSVQNN